MLRISTVKNRRGGQWPSAEGVVLVGSYSDGNTLPRGRVLSADRTTPGEGICAAEGGKL